MKVEEISKELMFLRARATIYALYGVLIAATSVVVATALVSVLLTGTVGTEGIILAQRSNVALWVLDALPFIFAAWGQYASMSMAKEAGTMVVSGTRRLRTELREIKAETQAKTDFFSKVSHELRAPLNGVVGMIDLLLETPLDKQQRRYATIVKDSAGSLLNLINDILDFSKIEAGKLALEDIHFNIRECLEGAAALFTSQANAKALGLKTFVQSTLPDELIGDPGRLRQILVNLISNAMKFTRKGEVAITAMIVRETEHDLILRVQVKDTGIGIAKDKLPQLFEPYRQGDAATARRFGGTGLGLAISKELVLAMGGKIGVSSEEGKGSTFWFTVALTKAATPARRIPAVALNGLRALVVDENPVLRDAVAEDLSAIGLEVSEAREGDEALQKALDAARAGQPFDVIITDMFTPRLDGEELGRQIKARPETQNALLIIMTAVGQRGDALRLSEIGFSAYINKPIKSGQLEHVISGAIALRGMSDEERRRHGLITRYTLEQRAKEQRLRVLLAEDSAVNREVLQHTFTKLGFNIDIAIDGGEAVEAARRHTYDLIFMDYYMPVLDGPGAIAAIRGLPAPNGAAPIIVLTSGISDADKRACLDHGASSVLLKPIGMGELLKTVWSLVTLPEDAAMRTPDTGDDLLQIFTKEAAERLRSLSEGLTLADAPRVAREAHTLKGISKHLEAQAVSEIAARIEQLAEGADLAAASLLVPLLERELDAFSARLGTLDPNEGIAASVRRAV